jgi:flagellar basal-body rod protein FlgC
MIDILPGIRSTASALTAERIRMDVISQNIAHANSTTRGPDGHPYQRKLVVFETHLQEQLQPNFDGPAPESVIVSRIIPDPHPPRLVYNPDHPDADANGNVAMPDINIHSEMVDLIVASRTFEANLAVMKHARNMAIQTLAIGKH